MNYPWFTYIIECKDGTFYVGVSRNVDTRVWQHNRGLPWGAKYTHPRRPVHLRASLGAESRSEACQTEAAWKKLSRAEKIKLIDKLTPDDSPNWIE